MIYTVTFNPAIDYVVTVGEIRQGAVNRTEREEIFFGGKGINVSFVLAELGVPSRALGFTAGFTGRAIEDGVREMGVDADFVRLKSGNSRINVKLRSGRETEINGQGPDISPDDIAELYRKLDCASSGDTVILAGSIPKSLPADIYQLILERLSGRGIRTVVDATGQLLLNVLRFRPFLIKPNDQELGELFGKELRTDEEICYCAGQLQEMGARNVLVSMAEKGAILLDENGDIHRCGVCKGTVRNSVGAGDSMLAGFIAGCEKGGYDHALKLGTACGGATAFSEGLAKKELIMQLFGQL